MTQSQIARHQPWHVVQDEIAGLLAETDPQAFDAVLGAFRERTGAGSSPARVAPGWSPRWPRCVSCTSVTPPT